MPLFSIITINRNNAEGLLKTIESVASQSFVDYEYIIIDGASSDGSVEIIEKNRDSFRYWVSEADKGIYNAMNKGILKARGEYCIFLNSGDCFFNTNVLAYLVKSELQSDIIYGNCAFKLKQGLRIQKFPAELTFYWLFTEYLGHSSTLIRRSLFNTVGLYNEELKIVSDWEFFLLAICKNNSTTWYRDMIISIYEKDGLSTRSDMQPLIVAERKIVLQKHFTYFVKDYQDLDKLKKNTFKRKLKRFIKKQFLGK